MVIHEILSLATGIPVPPDNGRELVTRYLKKIGAEGCSFVAHLHLDTDNPHWHVIWSRARPDGGLVNIGWDFLRHREAAHAVAEEILGGREITRPNVTSAPTTDRAVTAGRRAARRDTGPCWIDPEVIRACLYDTLSPPEFIGYLRKNEIEAKFLKQKNGAAKGILFRKKGAKEWLSGSSIARDFSLPAISLKIQQNNEMAMYERVNLNIDRRNRRFREFG